MQSRTGLALVPLILRALGPRVMPGDIALDGEDALPIIVELRDDGLLLSRGTKITEVRAETTDDS